MLRTRTAQTQTDHAALNRRTILPRFVTLLHRSLVVPNFARVDHLTASLGETLTAVLLARSCPAE